MIRPINIKLNAAHPELPLVEATTFTGAPSSVFIRGVPKSVGNWSITAVNVAVTYPDNSTTTRAAVESAEGVWVATIPGTATSGRTVAGFRILADGIDENGAAVTGYILGVADFAVASLDVTPAPEPGETSYQMLYFDEVPSVLRKGDVAKIDGVLKFYNGTAWEPFAAPVTLDDTVTPNSGNGVKSSGIWSAIWGTASTAFTSLYDWCVNQLAGKVSKSGDTMTGDLKVIGSATRMVTVGENDTNSYVGLHQTGIYRDGTGNDKKLTFPENGGTFALTADIPYDLGTPTVIDTASSEVVEGETVNYGAATLADRTANVVQVTAATALDELRITFPAETSGKVRDFGLRVEIGTGSAALTAPALVPIAPTGETIKLENNAAEIPALADGTATAKGVTLLYFSETAPGVFVVKGEQVEEVA